MTSILLISHEGYASGTKKAVELILGEQDNVDYHELTGEKGIEIFKDELNIKINKLIKDKNNLIIVSDLKNGTPYNCALSIIASNDLWDYTHLFTGMNLNLILEIIMTDEEVLKEESQKQILLTAKEGLFQMNKKTWDKQCSEQEE
ncbi:PTS sugar transporter subunit IIA [Providencia manganoxydans]|uniref:PTS sugar transporter subunit IIA n=1 Tax=Providencia manganoxydans TaxID=2923283 RepID=UPI0034E53A0F